MADNYLGFGGYGFTPYGGGVAPTLQLSVGCYINGDNITPAIDSQPAYVVGEIAGVVSPIQNGYVHGDYDYPSVVLSDSPTAYWRLGESSGTFYDSSGNNNDSTYASVASRSQAGIPGGGSDSSVEFNGTDTHRIEFPPGVLDGTLDFSIEVWVRPDTIGSFDFVAGKSDGSGAWPGQIWNSGGAFNRKNGFGTDTVSGSNPPTTGVWTHVVAVAKSARNTFQLYQNGILVDERIGIGAKNDLGPHFYVGASLDTFFPEFDGLIDEVAVYDTALTRGQIEAHYAAGSREPRDYYYAIDSQSAFISAAGISTDTQDAYVYGLGVATPSQPCFIISSTEITSSHALFIFNEINSIGFQPCYIHSYTTITSSQPAFIQIQSEISSIKRCFIPSSGELLPVENCYIYGGNILTSSILAHIRQRENMRGSQLCFIKCSPSITSSVPCFIGTVNSMTASNPCFIMGIWVGEITPTTRAYIDGRVVTIFVRKNVFAYINGSGRPTISDSNNCYITSVGVINNWKFDDGSGTVVTDYTSGVNGTCPADSMWVQGPFIEGCNG